MTNARYEESGPGLRRGDSDTAPYRPDIDGLRAIAIVLVVAFHFGVPGIGGGYLGVDLFFVISGYLIGTIFERHPAISVAALIAFYTRRFKRLMPAFVFVAVVTVLLATLLLLPEDYEALLRSVRDSLGFTANRYFEKETTGYFAATATELPWLHTWSLSIEWQFYFVFPLILLALRLLPTRRLQIVGMAALVVASVAWSIAMVHSHPAQAYFSATARIFEFLLGALGAMTMPARPGRRVTRWVSGIGLLVLIGLALLFDASTAFPGISAFGVCLAGLAVIVVGPDGSLFSNRGLAWIGRRSYSIYLWHWPVVAFCNYVQWKSTAIETMIAIAGVVLLAAATYRFVEKPGIASTWRPTRTILVWWFVPFVLAAAGFTIVRNLGGLPARLGPEAVHAAANTQRFATHRYDRCHDDQDDDLEACAFGDLAAPTRALLIGDSHARHFRPFVQVLADDAHLKVYGLTESECLTLLGTDITPGRPVKPTCSTAIARDYALIRDGHYRYVFLAERWIGYAAGRFGGLDESLAAIVASGATPVLFKPVAEDGTKTMDCFYHHIKIRRADGRDCSIRRDNDYAVQEKRNVVEQFDRMARKYPTLVVIDPQAVQCDGNVCATVIDGTPIYSDAHHVIPFGSATFAQWYLARFGNPLARQPGAITP